MGENGEDADHGTWRHHCRGNLDAARLRLRARGAGGPPARLLRRDAAAGLWPWSAIMAAAIHSSGRRPPPPGTAKGCAGPELGCRVLDPSTGPSPERRLHWMKSLHFCTSPSAAPQGMIGTVEVEFFGEPSTSLSE